MRQLNKSKNQMISKLDSFRDGVGPDSKDNAGEELDLTSHLEMNYRPFVRQTISIIETATGPRP